MKLSRYAPPGVNLNTIKIFLILWLAASVIYSFVFLSNYIGWYESIQRVAQGDFLSDNYKAECYELMANCFSWFPVGSACALLIAVYHYIYFFQGAKSIYTMRRLSKKSELYKRIFVLPVAAALIFLLTGILLLFIYYGIYMLFTPEGWRNPSQFQKIWENLKWLI